MFNYRQMIPLVVSFISLAGVTTLMGCSTEDDDTVFKGQLELAASGKLPDEATARIALVERDDKTGRIHIVAERALHDVKQLPVEFELDVNSQRLEKDKQYGLSATITDKENKTRWKTLLPESVTTNESGRTEKLLLEPKRRVDGQNFQHYACEGHFEFDLFDNGQEAIVHMGKRQMRLQADTLPNKRERIFTDYSDNKLKLRKNHTVFYIDGDKHENCRPKDDRSGPDQ